MKILALMDYNTNAPTGFNTVSKNILPMLKKHFGKELKLDICATNFYPPIDAQGNYNLKDTWFNEDENTYVVSAKYFQCRQYLEPPLLDDFGRWQFLEMLEFNEIDYDGIFIMHDIQIGVSIIHKLKEILAKKKAANRKQFKSLFYFPVDCNLAADICHELSFFTQLATYTYFGKNKVAEHNPQLIKKIAVIPHGVNAKHFHPLPHEEKDEFRNNFFGWNAKKTIIGAVNRNHYRKDWATLIFGFKYAKENWPADLPQPFLYLHTVPDASNIGGWNLPLLLQTCNLVNNVDYKIFSPVEIKQGNIVETQTVDEGFLNKLYNSFDMFVSTATGGGWELTFTEAMACAVPCIVPKHTSFAEIAANGSRAILLEELLPISHTQESIVRQQCQYEEVGEKMMEVAQMIDTTEQALFKVVANGLAYTHTLDWNDIGKRFVELFKETY